MAVLFAFAGLALVAWRFTRKAPTDGGSSATGGGLVQTVRSGTMEIVLRAPAGTLRTGRNTFTIEFHSPSGDLVDVGEVRVSANMTMPGMVMSGNVQVQSAGVKGRYTATAEFGMAGSWPFRLEWNGPGGRGSVSFQGSVQ